MTPQAFWAAPADVVLAEAGSSAAGLTAEEAGERLSRVGPNEPAPPRRFEALRELGGFLLNPLVLILLVLLLNLAARLATRTRFQSRG